MLVSSLSSIRNRVTGKQSDVDNLIQLVKMTNAIPKGVYVDHAARVMKDELAMECDYLQESQFQMKYREMLLNDR